MINLMRELKDYSYYTEVAEEMILKGEGKSSLPVIDEVYHTVTSNHEWSAPRLIRIPKDEPNKFREIYMFNDYDNILLKVINKIFTRNLSDKLSPYVYSYKKGISTKIACKSVQENLNFLNINYVKIDLHRYFNSVPAPFIINKLQELVEDKDGINLLRKLYSLDYCITHKNTIEKHPLGLMPGTALSSFLANYILSELDNIIANRVDCYARYSDDILLIDKDIDNLYNNLDFIKEYLSNIGLSLNDKKTKIVVDPNSIEFLGLNISRDTIDISEKNFNKIKSNIYNICKKNRKIIEVEKKNTDYIVKKTLKEIYNYLYGGYLLTNTIHKNSKLAFVFQSITTIDTLKEIDYYTKDKLRYLITGKNNKANSVKVTTEALKHYGFISSVEMFNLYKLNKKVFAFKIQSLVKPLFIKRPKNIVPVQILESPKVIHGVYLFDIILPLYNTQCFIKCNNYWCKLTDIVIDYINKTITLGDMVLVENNKVLIDKLVVMTNNVHMEYIVNKEHLTSISITDEIIHKQYLETYSRIFPEDCDKINYLLKIDIKEYLEAGYYLKQNALSFDMFALLFYAYLYTKRIKSNVTYVIVGNKLPLIFESSLLYRE